MRALALSLLFACRVLGSREFALFYRQQHRAADPRRSVAINTVLAKYVTTWHLNFAT